MIARSKLRFPVSHFQFIERMLPDIGYPGVFPMLLKALNIKEEQFRDPATRIDGDQFLFFLRQLKSFPESLLPVQTVLKYYSWSGFGVLTLAGMSSLTIKDSLLVSIEHAHLFIPCVAMRFEEGDAESRMILELTTDFEEMGPAMIELGTCFMKRMAEELVGQLPRPTLHFAHGCWLNMDDRRAEKVYGESFDCDVRFNSSFSGASAPNELWNLPLKNSNKPTFEKALAILREEAEWLSPTESMSAKVLSVMRNGAASDIYLSQKQLASVLNVTARTLSRKLATEKTSFKDLMNKVRFESAQKLLKNSRLSISLIALKVGYQDSNAFIRAFKNYTGKTPASWRSANS
ncbi:AraC family transcriptional regulator [Alcanivorax sp. 1008]|uniref:helix-turn-helix domain-containing protein n=1 Tax=Alcanivorax sp. 1008 TaxID=2816853 RepID=UPI001D559302|nr:AraC family transcriptional regulator [Alcanivorax sp. 1008]MCC1497082.1 helix-turn-helix domain-containing protein [Alcanivorax sp. 1008]